MPEFRDRLRNLGEKTGFPVPGNVAAENIRFQPVRSSPKGTRVETQSEGSVTLCFKAAIRFWWPLPYAVIVCAVVVGLPLGWILGATLRSPFEPYNGGPLFWTIAIFAAATVASFRLTRPWVKLVANKRYIHIGPYYFDRDHYGGMRVGYELQTGASVLKNDFHDLSIGLQAIRLTYGPWGEDLPYLVNGYHANAIVLWLNLMIASVDEPPVGPTSSEHGKRTQAF